MMFRRKKGGSFKVQDDASKAGGIAQGTDQNDTSNSEVSVRDADFDQPNSSGGSEHGRSEAPEAKEVLSLPQVKELESQVEALKREVEENREKYLRALAELENYRKRALRERSDYLKYQGEPILLDILPVVDNLERALQHKDADPEKLRAGIELIYKMLTDVLAKWEVHGESSIGREFDPKIHSAISRVAVDDAAPGTIISELKKLYFYKDKLLRAAEVVVAAEKPEQPDVLKEEEAEEEAQEEVDNTEES